MTVRDHSYLLDDDAVAVHHHDNDRKDAILMPDRDGRFHAFTGPDAPTQASRLAKAPVSDLSEDLAVLGAGGRSRMTFSRRLALKGGMAAVGALLAPSLLPRYAMSASAAERGTVILLFLRGGADGLSLVAPLGDRNLGARRPTIALSESTSIPLDSMFALNANAEPLKPFWDNGSLAFIHATGNPAPTRSHFEKQFLCETGAAAATVKSGWLGRHLMTAPGEEGTFRAFTLGGTPVYTLAANQPTLGIGSLGTFHLEASTASPERVAADISAMWGDVGGAAAQSAKDTVASTQRISEITSRRYEPANGVQYEGAGLSANLAQVAQVLRAGITPEVVCIDAYGWDTHTNMRGGDGHVMKYQWASLARSLATFMTDLGPEMMARTTIVTMSEFGRTAEQNSSGGTDHGFGGTMMVMGGGVAGGKVYGRHPGMALSDLDGGGVAITNDYRDVLAELVRARLGNARNLPTIFPGYTPKPVGLFA